MPDAGQTCSGAALIFCRWVPQARLYLALTNPSIDRYGANPDARNILVLVGMLFLSSCATALLVRGCLYTAQLCPIVWVLAFGGSSTSGLGVGGQPCMQACTWDLPTSVFLHAGRCIRVTC